MPETTEQRDAALDALHLAMRRIYAAEAELKSAAEVARRSERHCKAAALLHEAAGLREAWNMLHVLYGELDPAL